MHTNVWEYKLSRHTRGGADGPGEMKLRKGLPSAALAPELPEDTKLHT